MEKPVIDEKRFVDEMNARILGYEGYNGGEVVLTPEGAKPEHASGYTWQGPGNGYAFMSRAYAEVRDAFTLQVAPNNRPS